MKTKNPSKQLVLLYSVFAALLLVVAIIASGFFVRPRLPLFARIELACGSFTASGMTVIFWRQYWKIKATAE
jgi:hypothetical protein